MLWRGGTTPQCASIASEQPSFDTIEHDWLIKFIEHRVADTRVVRLIKEWLRAGVLEEGRLTQSELGTVQGGSISPLLANIYLHYAFDPVGGAMAGASCPRRRDRGALCRRWRAAKAHRRIDPPVQSCCARDEGGPLEAGVHAQASNHPLLLRLRGVVVSEMGKGRA